MGQACTKAPSKEQQKVTNGGALDLYRIQAESSQARSTVTASTTLGAGVPDLPTRVDWRNYADGNFIPGIIRDVKGYPSVACAVVDAIGSAMHFQCGVDVVEEPASTAVRLPPFPDQEVWSLSGEQPCLYPRVLDMCTDYSYNRPGIVPGTAYGWPFTSDTFSHVWKYLSLNSELLTSVKRYATIPRGNIPAMQAALATTGPLMARIIVYPDFVNFSGDGVYKPKADQTRQNQLQALLIIGYDVTDADNPYWICKNSYGSAWGDNGCVKIAFNQPMLLLEGQDMYQILSFSSVYPHCISHAVNNFDSIATDMTPSLCSFNGKLYIFYRDIASGCTKYTMSADLRIWPDGAVACSEASACGPSVAVFNDCIYMFWADLTTNVVKWCKGEMSDSGVLTFTASQVLEIAPQLPEFPQPDSRTAASTFGITECDGQLYMFFASGSSMNTIDYVVVSIVGGQEVFQGRYNLRQTLSETKAPTAMAVNGTIHVYWQGTGGHILTTFCEDPGTPLPLTWSDIAPISLSYGPDDAPTSAPVALPGGKFTGPRLFWTRDFVIQKDPEIKTTNAICIARGGGGFDASPPRPGWKPCVPISNGYDMDASESAPTGCMFQGSPVLVWIAPGQTTLRITVYEDAPQPRTVALPA